MKYPLNRVSTIQLKGYLTVDGFEKEVLVRVHIVRSLPRHYKITQVYYCFFTKNRVQLWARVTPINAPELINGFLSSVTNPRFGGRSAMGVIDLKMRLISHKQNTSARYTGTPSILKGRESSEF